MVVRLMIWSPDQCRVRDQGAERRRQGPSARGTAWEHRAAGDRRLASQLAICGERGAITLHDRAVPEHLSLTSVTAVVRVRVVRRKR